MPPKHRVPITRPPRPHLSPEPPLPCYLATSRPVKGENFLNTCLLKLIPYTHTPSITACFVTFLALFQRSRARFLPRLTQFWQARSTTTSHSLQQPFSTAKSLFIWLMAIFENQNLGTPRGHILRILKLKEKTFIEIYH